jgi:hypothetical protein
MDRRVLLFVGFQDPKAGNAERESPRGTFLPFRSFGFVRGEAAFSRLYPGSIGADGGDQQVEVGSLMDNPR